MIYLEGEEKVKATIKLFLVIHVLFSIVIAESTGNQKVKEEKGSKYLVCADTGFGIIYDVEIIDKTLKTIFVSNPLLRFHVPASPESDALHIEWWTTFVYAWSDYKTRNSDCKICLRIISDVIPDNVDVRHALTVHRGRGKNHILNLDAAIKRVECISKVIMRRDNVDSWIVIYESEYRASDEMVLPIFNKLIDRGFDVEVWAEESVQGMKIASYRNVTIEIAPLIKVKKKVN